MMRYNQRFLFSQPHNSKLGQFQRRNHTARCSSICSGCPELCSPALIRFIAMANLPSSLSAAPTSSTTTPPSIGNGVVRQRQQPVPVSVRTTSSNSIMRPGNAVPHARPAAAPTNSSATQLPTPLARSMASTANRGPPPPPPPASLSSTPPFLTKLYNLVEDVGTSELVSWTDDLTAFTVHKPDEFQRDVLPRYFKHNNFSSFVRQLNQYGFHKRDPDRWTFGHDNFRRGRLDLLRLISRRRSKSAAATVAAVPNTSEVSVYPATGGTQAVVEIGNFGLAGKVESLQRDKEVLVKELVITRKAENALQEKCDNLENRLEFLESSTKQMQNFILHYFSKVLQPYSDEIATRKRKRLPPAAPTSNGFYDSVSPATNISGASASTTKARSPMTGALPPPTGSSLEALQHMMQQMQMNQGNTQNNARGNTVIRPLQAEMDPAVVQEIMHDETKSASSSEYAVSKVEAVAPLWENENSTKTTIIQDELPQTNEEIDFMDLNDELDLLPPLTALPEGTDISALARHIEGFGDTSDTNS